ncbi:MAG: porin [Candidatus Cloacimonetes bacterium]|nr:porin [Candidatus Cloacimonadota bacterium]
MKKVIILLVVLLSASFLLAEVNFYGSLRTGWWYTSQNEDYTGSKARFDFSNNFYSDSRVGMDYLKDGFTAKVELGLNQSYVTLRHAYGEQDLGMFEVLVGRTYSGFSDFAAQGYGPGSDIYLAGYGMLYDGFNTMVKFSLPNGIYFAFMQPAKMNFLNLYDYEIDAVIPKINVGMHYEIDGIKLHPTFGIAMCNYNKDFSGTDEGITAYAAAISAEYDMNPLVLKVQFGYGQNIGNYGFKTISYYNGYAMWDMVNDEIMNATTTSAYLQAGFGALTIGGGYVMDDIDYLEDPDATMCLFGQYKLMLGNICLMPEFGMFDYMEDGMGEKQGAVTYFGTQLRVSIP